jgi:hypothetical protein
MYELLSELDKLTRLLTLPSLTRAIAIFSDDVPVDGLTRLIIGLDCLFSARDILSYWVAPLLLKTWFSS